MSDLEKYRRSNRILSFMSVFFACAAAGFFGYAMGLRADRGPPPAAGQPAAAPPAVAEAPPRVAPLDTRRAPHPTFDCTQFAGEVTIPATGEVRSIGGLADAAAGAAVKVRGRVMNAYPRIMGVNWIHLCDAAQGEVLVVATVDWAHPGDEVVAGGVLARDRNIGGVYVFPLLLEQARLEGDRVIREHARKPTFDL